MVLDFRGWLLLDCSRFPFGSSLDTKASTFSVVDGTKRHRQTNYDRREVWHHWEFAGNMFSSVSISAGADVNEAIRATLSHLVCNLQGEGATRARSGWPLVADAQGGWPHAAALRSTLNDFMEDVTTTMPLRPLVAE